MSKACLHRELSVFVGLKSSAAKKGFSIVAASIEMFSMLPLGVSKSSA